MQNVTAADQEGVHIRQIAHNLMTRDRQSWQSMEGGREWGKRSPTKDTPLSMSEARQMLSGVLSLTQALQA